MADFVLWKSTSEILTLEIMQHLTSGMNCFPILTLLEGEKGKGGGVFLVVLIQTELSLFAGGVMEVN